MESKRHKVGQGKFEPDTKCIECQNLKIKFGAINSMVCFELETLSQHRLIIGQLQDEVFSQHNQIEDLQFLLEQWEKNQGQTSTPINNWNVSRNLSEASVFPIPDLNEPAEATWEQQVTQAIKHELGD
jgi:hypothetical protein